MLETRRELPETLVNFKSEKQISNVKYALCDAGGAGYCDKEIIISQEFSDFETQALCDAGGAGYCDKGIVENRFAIKNAELPKFDLSNVRAKVAKNNPTLSEDALNKGEQIYREFLKKAKENPDEKFSPTLLEDEFWHSHILFTRKYMNDCKEYFGYFLHHNPQE